MLNFSENLIDFSNQIITLENNREIVEAYKGYLQKYSHTDFGDYTFIVGTNDSIGVSDSNFIKSLSNKQFSIDDRTIYTYDILNNYQYCLLLNKNFEENFGIHVSCVIDTNIAGLFSKFISENKTNGFIEEILHSPYIDLNFLCFVMENIHNPYRDLGCKDKQMSILDNLCKFNSLYRDIYIKDRTLQINDKHYSNMFNFLKNNFQEYALADYNFVYTYLAYAFLEKNSKEFNIEYSLNRVITLMQENGTNYSELLEFIYIYFKNGNNKFFNATNTETQEEICKKIQNMSWDIFLYYFSRYSVTHHIEGANFGFPIFATMDKRFTENYPTLFKGKVIVLKNNQFQCILRKPNEVTEKIQKILTNKKDQDFQRDKQINPIERYQLALRLKNHATMLLGKIKCS